MHCSKYVFLILLFFVFSVINVDAQNPNLNLIVFAKKYKKGFYRTFEEFRNNSPSIPFDIEPGNYQAARINFKGNPPCPEKTTIWGFCDGIGIYISKSFSFSEKEIYYRIQYIGRFCDFATTQNHIDIDFNTGKMFVIDKQAIEAIIFKDEELYTSFSEDPRKKIVTREYLRYYSKKHTEEIDLIIVPK